MNLPHTNIKNIAYPPGGILMWIIIFLELLTFGATLIAFVWTGKQTPDVFHQSSEMLNTVFGAINTVFLLVSGFFMAEAVRVFQLKDGPKTKRYLAYAILGGLLFMGLKGYEYYLKIEAGLTVDFNSFFSYYWLLKGFHVIHVLIGLVILSVLYFNLKKGKKILLEDLEASAAFWHMCDLIWLLLFPVLYLIF